MKSFQVSVIIPVYNAASFVPQAVESALAQPEVAEVVLVEDGSPDDSLSVCQALAAASPKVTLHQHPGGVNRGAGPSRNLGMQHATCDYIAFLDADDFYLPGRFAKPAEIFAQDAACDGVYEAVGAYFEDEAGRERWLASSMAGQTLTTMAYPVAPEDLFEVLIKGGKGHVHLNGLVIRRSILAKSGLMDAAIADTLHEDVDFVMRLAAVGKLLPGRIDVPSAVRRVHAENRVSAPRSGRAIYRDRMRLRAATYRWCKRKGLKAQRLLAFRRMLWECTHQKPFKPGWLNHLPFSSLKTARLLSWPCEVPEVVLEPLFWRELGSALWGILRNDLLKLEDRL